MDLLNSLNEIALIIFLICISLYFSLFYLSFKGSKPTKFKVYKKVYEQWVQYHIENNTPLVGVQALRNFIMANSTFVSALFILLGILVGFYRNFVQDFSPFWGYSSLSLGIIQITLNVILITFCLSNFILSIRLSARLSILISGNPEKITLGNIKGIEVTKKTLISAYNHWMLGIRGLFFLMTTLLWFISSILFIISTLIVTFYLLVLHEIL